MPSPILVASQYSSDVLFFAVGGKVFKYRVKANDGAADAQIPLEAPSSSAEVVALAATHHGVLFVQFADGLSSRVVYDRDADYAPSVTKGATATLLPTSAVTVAAGNHVWRALGSELRATPLLNRSSGDTTTFYCAAGMLPSAGACVQLGMGLVTADRNTEVPCPKGTYASQAGGGSLWETCQLCPEGAISEHEGAVFCVPCPLNHISDGARTRCISLLDGCPANSYANSSLLSLRGCVQCPPGFYTQPDTPAYAIDACLPCPANTYIEDNRAPGAACVPCPGGKVSLPGSHHCVVSCPETQCASTDVEPQTCRDKTNRFQTMTQVKLTDARLWGVTVDPDGGVFSTDSKNVFYYFDSCSADAPSCVASDSQVGLLPPHSPRLSAFETRDIRALALVKLQHTVTAADGSKRLARHLYFASFDANTIARFLVVYKPGGTEVDAQETLRQAEGASIELIAGVPGPTMYDGTISRLKDNVPAAEALFHGVVDIEVTFDGTVLFLSDMYNFRVRKLFNAASDGKWYVTSVLGHAPGKPRNWGLYGFAATEASVGWLGGLTLHESDSGLLEDAVLYVAMTTTHAIGKLTRIGWSDSRFASICKFQRSLYVAENDYPMSCSSTLSRSCPLNSVNDIAVAPGNKLYAVFVHGITELKSILDSVPGCTQIAGQDFNLVATGAKDGYSPLSVAEAQQALDLTIAAAPTEVKAAVNAESTFLNYPYRVVFASARSIIYLADMNNGAVRRIFVTPPCTCAPGLLSMSESHTCYDPARHTAGQPKACPQGFYALEGDAVCRSCAAAANANANSAATSADSIARRMCVSANEAAAAAANLAATGRTFAAAVEAPPLLAPGDWFGRLEGAPAPDALWDDMVRVDGRVEYFQGGASGRAPSGGEFVSLTYQPLSGTWSVDATPVLLAPGIWYPCAAHAGSGDRLELIYNTVASQTLRCSNAPFSLGDTMVAQLREEAALGRAISLASLLRQPKRATLQSLKDVVTSQSVGDDAGSYRINLYSRFFALGTPDAAPRVCQGIQNGPCLTEFQHVNGLPSTVARTPLVQTPAQLQAWSPAADVRAYMGWPAHYACPDGYMWVSPEHQVRTAAAEWWFSDWPGLRAHVACLSCLPGWYSARPAGARGGPYACTPCPLGEFSDAVGASACTLCSQGFYADTTGATVCTRCSLPGVDLSAQTTTIQGSYDARQCVACLPGTGRCESCALGQFQDLTGQIHCVNAPPGTYVPVMQATYATPCPLNTYNAFEARTACERCPPSTHTNGSIGATACMLCADAACPALKDGVCGRGCGLNRYWSPSSAACELCPAGKINTRHACGVGIEACYDTDRVDLFVNASRLDVDGGLQHCPPGKRANAQFDACVPCAVGTFSSGTVPIPTTTSSVVTFANQACTPCPPGTYASAAGATACLPCAKGTYAAGERNTECARCERGAECRAEGLNASSPCPPGRYSNALGTVNCNLCAAGKSQSLAGTTECIVCEQHTFNIREGATRCTDCLGIVDTTSTECLGCGLGQYYEPAELQCKSCPAGTVNLRDTHANSSAACAKCPAPFWARNSTTCELAADGRVPNAAGDGETPCAAGAYRQGSGMPACAPCSPGTVSSNEGAAACQPCPAGQYQSAAGKSACAVCPVGTVSATPGAPACVACPAGSSPQDGQTVCVLCKPNTFAATNASVACAACPAEMVSAAGSTRCGYCPRFQIASSQQPGVCQPCPKGQYAALPFPNAPYYACGLCPAGRVVPYAGATSAANCTYCPESQVAAPDHDRCDFCPPGQYAAKKGVKLYAECSPCPPGTYSNGAGTRGVCVPCAAGTYADAAGSPACTPCRSGSYANASGAVACAPCPVGTYAANRGSVSCAACAAPGEQQGFAANEGQEGCTPWRQSCAAGAYMQRALDPARNDHLCVLCSYCADTQYTLVSAFDTLNGGNASLLFAPGSMLSVDDATDQGALFRKDVERTPALLCPGNTFAPAFVCVDGAPVAGKYLALNTFSGAASVYRASGGGDPPIQQSDCTPLSPEQLDLFDYVPGPSPFACYVGCRNGLQSAAAPDFYVQTLNAAGIRVDYASESPYQNQFKTRIFSLGSSAAQQICVVDCPAAPCAQPGAYRPLVRVTAANGRRCGPPCGIPGSCGTLNFSSTSSSATSAAQVSDEGCTAACAPPPEGAAYVGGGVAVGDPASCPWMCNRGWHLNNPETGCEPCLALGDDDQLNGTRVAEFAAQVAQYCGGESYAHVSPSQCLPGMNRSAVCKLCPARLHADVAGVNARLECVYRCHKGYYDDNNGSCLWCANATRCDAGHYLDVAACGPAPPVCRACGTPPSVSVDTVSFISDGGLDNPMGCKAICRAGYRTLKDGNILRNDNAQMASGLNVSQLTCQRCVVGDTTACAFLGCSLGQFRNVSVPDNQLGSCKACKASSACAAGFYAEPCAANVTADATCTPCPPIDGSEMFLDYATAAGALLARSRIRYSRSDACPRVCRNNYWYDSAQGRCIPCLQRRLDAFGGDAAACMSTPSATTAASTSSSTSKSPPPCAFRYSYWAALPAPAWWSGAPTVELSETSAGSGVYQRAGECWACPYGFDTAEEDTSLCVLSAGFSRASQGAQVVALPTIPIDARVYLNEPRPPNLAAVLLAVGSRQPAASRRLLASSDANSSASDNITAQLLEEALAKMKPVVINATAAASSEAAVACPSGYFKPQRGDGACSLCPQASTTAAQASTSRGECACLPGYERAPNGGCTPCRPDQYRPLLGDNRGGGACVPCPPNETTYGRVGEAACSCVPGMLRAASGACEPCPRNHFCTPCLATESCPVAGGSIVTRCPEGERSEPASWQAEQCDCSDAGYGKLRVWGLNDNAPVCTRLPPGVRSSGSPDYKALCRDEWFAPPDTQLTDPATNALVGHCVLCPKGQYVARDPPNKTCIPCPADTYDSSGVASGCASCPDGQSTNGRTGATSIDECVCPAGRGKKGATGACATCSTAEYATNTSAGCALCPPNMLSRAGASSVDECLCIPGHRLIASSQSSSSSTSSSPQQPVSLGCEPCPLNYYGRPYASRAGCEPCPPGHLTLETGSRARGACGATADLCLPGYIFKSTGGCVPKQIRR